MKAYDSDTRQSITESPQTLATSLPDPRPSANQQEMVAILSASPDKNPGVIRQEYLALFNQFVIELELSSPIDATATEVQLHSDAASVATAGRPVRIGILVKRGGLPLPNTVVEIRSTPGGVVSSSQVETSAEGTATVEWTPSRDGDYALIATTGEPGHVTGYGVLPIHLPTNTTVHQENSPPSAARTSKQ